MTMKKIVNTAVALLTTVSVFCLCSISAFAAQTSGDELTDDDIAFLQSKGYSDDYIASVQQNMSNRSGNQLNHYVFFSYNYDPYATNTFLFDLYRQPDISYFDYVAGNAGTNVYASSIGGTDWPGWYHDNLYATINGIGLVAAFRYTCASDTLWTGYLYSPIAYVNDPVLMGDVNCDDKITVGDLQWMYSIQQGNYPTGLTGDGMSAADINCNYTSADNNDISLLAQYLAGSRNCFWT